MKRFFGFGKKKKKQRLSPSELPSPYDEFHAETISPMYQYARNEFAQTDAPGTSNDDGRGVLYTSPSDTPRRLFSREPSVVSNAGSGPTFNNSWTSPSAQHTDDDTHSFTVGTANGVIDNPHVQQQHSLNSASMVSSRASSLIDGPAQQDHQSVVSSSRQRQGAFVPSYQPPQHSSQPFSPGYQPPTHNNTAVSPELQTNNNNTININSANADPDYIAACSASNLGRQESLFSQASSQYPTNMPKSQGGGPQQRHNCQNPYSDCPPSWEIPDATYEEEYGDAYIGGPIRYVYPRGYQTMRPRSGPWKLSIVICILFTWLSVFIVGHCSDRVDSDESQYNQNEIDDDTLVIETRWCGSRLLYMMWVISMLVTGLAAAYCSIIGYIKVRDFAVANGRSQPPGMVGKTDFYAQVDDAMPPPIQETSSQGSFASSHHRNHYHVPIYQADGNPQFWGGHIYRPTQAAVALSSR